MELYCGEAFNLPMVGKKLEPWICRFFRQKKVLQPWRQIDPNLWKREKSAAEISDENKLIEIYNDLQGPVS